MDNVHVTDITNLNLLLLLILRLTSRIGRKSDPGKGEPGLRLPALLEGKLDLILQDIRHKGFIIGSIFSLNFDKKSVIHFAITQI